MIKRLITNPIAIAVLALVGILALTFVVQIGGNGSIPNYPHRPDQRQAK